MKIFTRLLALALAGVMSVCLLTGCQDQGNPSASDSAPGTVPEVVDIAAIDDICLYLSGLDADEVVAKGRDIQVTAGELMYWIAASCDSMLNYYYYYSGTTQLPWDTTDEAGKTTLADFVLEDALKYAAIQRLVAEKGSQAGFALTQENMDAIQGALDSMQAEATAAELSLQNYLFQQGLTEDQFRWIFECDYIYEALASANFGPESSNPPTEESIRALREAQGEYKVKHILLATVDTTTREPLDEKAAAEKKATAERLLADLRSSADPMTLFDEYMNTYSEDPGLATNPEGYIFTANTSVDPAFEEAALALEYGQISELVEGVSGYHIILRLPLGISLEEDSQVYVNTKMGQLTEEWLEQANIKNTKAFNKLDARTIYERLTAYRDAASAPADSTNSTENQPQE